MDFLHSLIFYVLAAVVIASAAFTAFSSNLVHAAFSLLFTFFGLACLYIQLGADFVGVAQVLIYVGGILVLLLFGVMFTGSLAGGSVRQTIQYKWGLGLLVLLGLLLAPIIFSSPWFISDNPQGKNMETTVSAIGQLLLSEYLLPFEIASLLLLVALIGAVVIARSETKIQQENGSGSDTAIS